MLIYYIILSVFTIDLVYMAKNLLTMLDVDYTKARVKCVYKKVRRYIQKVCEKKI